MASLEVSCHLSCRSTGQIVKDTAVAKLFIASTVVVLSSLRRLGPESSSTIITINNYLLVIQVIYHLLPIISFINVCNNASYPSHIIFSR